MAHGGWYILRGHQVVPASNMLEAARLFEDIANRTVCQTMIKIRKQESKVSTVFLGLDHGFSDDPNAPPVVFETLVFGGPLDDMMRRYVTWDEAQAGHDETVTLVKKALKDGKVEQEELKPYIRRTWHDRVLEDDD